MITSTTATEMKPLNVAMEAREDYMFAKCRSSKEYADLRFDQEPVSTNTISCLETYKDIKVNYNKYIFMT